MSTITPNGDIRQTINVTNFVVGDKIIQLDSNRLAGTVIEVNSGGDPLQMKVLFVNGTNHIIPTNSARRL